MMTAKKVLIPILLAVFIAAAALFGLNSAYASVLTTDQDTSLTLNVTYSPNQLSVSVSNGGAGYQYQYWIKTKVVTDGSSNLGSSGYIWQMYGQGFVDDSAAQIAVGANDIDENDSYNVIVRVKDGSEIVAELYKSFALADVGQPAISSIELFGETYKGDDLIVDKKSRGPTQLFEEQVVFNFLMNECLLDGSNGTFNTVIESGTVTFTSQGGFEARIIPTFVGGLGGMDNPTIISGTYYIANGVCYISGDANMECEIQVLPDGKLKGSIETKIEGRDLKIVCQSAAAVDIALGNLVVGGNIDGITYKVYYGDSAIPVIESNRKDIILDFSSYPIGRNVFRVEAIYEENVATAYFSVYIYDEYEVFDNLNIVSLTGQTNTASGETTFYMELQYPDGRDIEAGEADNFEYSLISGRYTCQFVDTTVSGNTITAEFYVDYASVGIYQTIGKVTKIGKNCEDDKVIQYYDGYARDAQVELPQQSGAIASGDTVEITAENAAIRASFGAGDDYVAAADLRYAFYREDASGWVLIKDWTTDNTLNWTPLREGNYKIQVRVKEAGAGSYEATASREYVVGSTDLDDLSFEIIDCVTGMAVSDDEIYAGKAYKLVADIDDEDLLYMFTYNSASVGLIYLNKFNPSPYLLFIPTKPEEFTLTARVISAANFGYKDISASRTITPRLLEYTDFFNMEKGSQIKQISTSPLEDKTVEYAIVPYQGTGITPAPGYGGYVLRIKNTYAVPYPEIQFKLTREYPAGSYVMFNYYVTNVEDFEWNVKNPVTDISVGGLNGRKKGPVGQWNNAYHVYDFAFDEVRLWFAHHPENNTNLTIYIDNLVVFEDPQMMYTFEEEYQLGFVETGADPAVKVTYDVVSYDEAGISPAPDGGDNVLKIVNSYSAAWPEIRFKLPKKYSAGSVLHFEYCIYNIPNYWDFEWNIKRPNGPSLGAINGTAKGTPTEWIHGFHVLQEDTDEIWLWLAYGEVNPSTITMYIDNLEVVEDYHQFTGTFEDELDITNIASVRSESGMNYEIVSYQDAGIPTAPSGGDYLLKLTPISTAADDGTPEIHFVYFEQIPANSQVVFDYYIVGDLWGYEWNYKLPPSPESEGVISSGAGGGLNTWNTGTLNLDAAFRQVWLWIYLGGNQSTVTIYIDNIRIVQP